MEIKEDLTRKMKNKALLHLMLFHHRTIAREVKLLLPNSWLRRCIVMDLHYQETTLATNNNKNKVDNNIIAFCENELFSTHY